MDIWVQIVWWIGLIGALLLTVVILKEVALLHKVLRDIYELSRRTDTASRGIANHVAGAPAADEELERLARTARALPVTATALAAAAAELEQVLANLAPDIRPVQPDRRER